MADERVAVPDESWHLAADEGRKCRQSRCPNAAVAKFKRHHSYGPRRWQWWHYCAEHLYGRWIENGRVMHYVVAGSPAHERAGQAHGDGTQEQSE